MMTSDPVIEFLKQSLPCRDSQIDQLYNLIPHKDHLTPPCIYVYGGASTGKTTLVTSMLQQLEIKHAIVNLVECYTSKILFESILNKLSDHKLDPTNPVPYARCDNLIDFISHLQAIEGLDRSVIVLDKAEELRNMEVNLLPGILRIRELTNLKITMILISDIVFEKYYSKSTNIEPLKVYFPQYNKDDLLEILTLDFDYVRKLAEETSVDFDVEFYKNYLNLFLSVFYRACRDLCELRHMSRSNFMKYIQPVVQKQCSVTDSMSLWRNISPILKNSLEVLYLRVDVTSEQMKSAAHSLELPYYAKYLLVAAYLASYNSAKDDKKLFVRNAGRKSRSVRDVKTKSKVSEQLNTQLGPKPFTFDRLLAIFYAILEEKVGFNNNLLAQVSSLVELRLLSTIGDGTSLDGQKYKCNVSFDFVHSIAKTIGFNIRKYLSDFSHL
ncbi:unnamed protein product [Acanthoscelides obtectus]|uniref:Origin recognition complex subunit 5 n=1 Tax=Acanthoscelides obtectus TaxID=200917 RepID=A0A9P0L1W6_ACAOB|nr:unnamed protein product [Acanthoscelides obtectus]CAK1622235.1 Origin recognition complex subunit 5 [Acanthoscelides obtectus]